MARTDWIALTTDPAAEYLALSELCRFGLEPYLPQARRRYQPVAGKLCIRFYPLFPRYLLLPVRQLDRSVLRMCRGVKKLMPVLCDREGNVWRAPDSAVRVIREAEVRGEFSENFQKGVKVRLNSPILQEIHAVIEKNDEKLLTLFSPLFGGARMKVSRQDVQNDGV